MKRVFANLARTIGSRLRRFANIIGDALNGPANDNRTEYIGSMTSLSSHRRDDHGLPMRRR